MFVAAAGLKRVAQEAAAPVEADKTKARIEGTVVSGDSKTPLNNATLRLRPADLDRYSPPNPDAAAYTASSDAEGHFVFQDTDPGSYLLFGDAAGHVRQFYGASPSGNGWTVLRVEAGQTVKDLTLRLPPQGGISGRALDADDRGPVRDAEATAWKVAYSGGARSLIPTGFADVNAQGEFLIRNLPAGRYLVGVRAATRFLRAGATQEKRGEPPKGVYLTTYYPEDAESSTALPVKVQAGQVTPGVDIRLRKSLMYAVRGTAKASDLANAGPVRLALMPATADLTRVFSHPTAQVRAGGTFEFDQVSAGDYFLQPERLFRGDDSVAGFAEVSVRDRDVERIEIHLTKAPDLAGRIRLESGSSDTPADTQPPAFVQGAGPKAASPPSKSTAEPPKAAVVPPPPGHVEPSGHEAAAPAAVAPPAGHAVAIQTAPQTAGPVSLAGITVGLHAAEGVSVNSPRAVSRADGTFDIRKTPLGRYRVDVARLPEGVFLKSIAYNGQEVTHTVLDLTSGAAGALEVVLSPDGGTIAGVVRDANRRALPGTWVSVWRSGQAAEMYAEPPRATPADQTGTFRFAGLEPGEYRIAAWEDIEPSLSSHRPFCVQFDGSAEKVQLDAKANRSVELQPVASDVVAAAAGKIP
jgi:hypothetical protein